jgi:RND family efflux transporter MFP subunit
MRRSNLIVGSALLLGAIVVAAAPLARIAVAAAPSAKTEPKVQAVVAKPIRTKAVEHRPVMHPICATGTVRSKNNLELSFLIGGQVTWVGADVGAVVHRGQVLARIDTAQIAADTDRARAAAIKARRDLKLMTTLVASEAMPQNSLDDAETADTLASAAQRAAEFALRHGVLVAPDDGVIGERRVDVGEIVGAGQPILHLNGKSKGAVVSVAVSDRDVVGLEIGRQATVRVDALADEAIEAKVSQVATDASPASGTYVVELRLKGKLSLLRDGMTAKVTIERVITPGSVVPIAALAPADNASASVVVVDGGVAHRVHVRPLFFEGDVVGLAEPLAGVTSVATEGSTTLTEGASVEVVP